MAFRCFLEVGWVAYISFGLHARKLVTVIDVWSELGFGWWILHLSKETSFAFQMHAVQWLYPRVPTKCLPKLFPTSLAQGRYQYKMGSHAMDQEDGCQRKQTPDDWLRSLQSMKAKKKKNWIIKLNEVRKLQKAPLLKASPKKACAANGVAAVNVSAKSDCCSQKVAPPKVQKGLKSPAQKASAPKASGKKV